MERGPSLRNLIWIIFVIGALLSFLMGDLPLGTIFSGLGGGDLESNLELVNLGLMILTLAIFVGFLFYRAIRSDDQDGPLNPWENEREDD